MRPKLEHAGSMLISSEGFGAGESEALQEGGKEEKEIHSGQSLSQTHPLP